MYQALFAALLFLLVPVNALATHPPAASFSVAQSVLAASSSPGNAYAAGASIVLTAPVAGDFSGLGGSVITAAPIVGDTLLFGGSLHSRGSVGGDLRAAGGNITVEGPVAGDLVAFGYDVDDTSRPGGNVFIIAANTTLAKGANGPVTIYGNNIALAGDFGGDVDVVAGGRLSLAASTTIRGKLSYQAPVPAVIPASVTVTNGISYTNASYLPDAGTSRTLALVSMGFFIFVRILGALILAGLLAGLFPRLAEAVVERADMKLRSVLLTLLLGFAVLVATPVLLALLSLTFVGIGIALLLLILYALLVLLAVVYAGILLGCLFVRRYLRRDTVLWHDGILGMLALSLIALVPIVGYLAALLLTVFSAGALLQIFFHTAFPHEEETPEVL